MLDLFDEKPKAGDKIAIIVTPNASRTRVKTEHKPDGTRQIRVYVTTPAEDGRANKAVIDLLAETWGLPKSTLTITHGLTGRHKIVAITL